MSTTMIHIDNIFYVTIFNGKKCTRKTYLKLHFHCGPLKKSKRNFQYVRNAKTETDTKCCENVITVCEHTMWKAS